MVIPILWYRSASVVVSKKNEPTTRAIGLQSRRSSIFCGCRPVFTYALFAFPQTRFLGIRASFVKKTALRPSAAPSAKTSVTTSSYAFRYLMTNCQNCPGTRCTCRQDRRVAPVIIPKFLRFSISLSETFKYWISICFFLNILYINKS